MSVDASAILAQTPRWYRDGTDSPFGLPYDEIPGAVRTAVEGIVWRPGDRRALRLLAYALYSDAVTEDESALRVTGDAELLAADVLAELAHDQNHAFGLDDLVRAVLRQVAGEQRATSADQGWALTILEFVSQAAPGVVPILLLQENSDAVARWALQRWWSPSRRVAIVEAFMRRIAAPNWDAAAALIVGAGRDHILRNDPAPSLPLTGSRDARLAAIGVTLTQLYAYGQSTRLAEDQRARWDDLVATIRAQVAGDVTSRSALEVLRAGLDTGDDSTVVTLLLDVADRGMVGHVTREGDAVLRRYFRRLDKREPGRSDEAVAYMAPLVIDNLARIWAQIGADANFFDELRDNLRCDEFSYAFTFTHYLIDRRRALILCAIAAVAAKRLNDIVLLQRAGAFATMLRRLPAGVASPFSAQDRENIFESTAVDLPPDEPLFGA